MRDWIRQRLPGEDTLKAHPGLRWMGPLLRRPWLWHLNRRRVAVGAGIGVFFGFLIPVLQIAAAAAFAVMLRANLPVAAAATLVSNPLTYAPIAVLAYQTGAAVLGQRVDPKAAAALSDAAAREATHAAASVGWVERAKAIGKPLFVGLAIFATVGGLAAWALVHGLWTLGVWLKRRGRRRARAVRGSPV
ncbi:MAG: DUF2062 domain-containing protein [Burkholderiales bacterium]|nr:DUF2062 domain-containing protein [Burkholderiales bacterium]